MTTTIYNAVLGKVITEIENCDDGRILKFSFSDGTQWEMYHEQDCCECVTLEDIAGELYDLLNSPLTMAEEVTENDPKAYERGMWTFYKFATVKGYVTLRWYGQSNGYYSVGVTFEELPPEGRW